MKLRMINILDKYTQQYLYAYLASGKYSFTFSSSASQSNVIFFTPQLAANFKCEIILQGLA